MKKRSKSLTSILAAMVLIIGVLVPTASAASSVTYSHDGLYVVKNQGDSYHICEKNYSGREVRYVCVAHSNVIYAENSQGYSYPQYLSQLADTLWDMHIPMETNFFTKSRLAALEKTINGENDQYDGSDQSDGTVRYDYDLSELHVVRPVDSRTYWVCYTGRSNGETYYYDMDDNIRCILNSSGNEKSAWRTNYRTTLKGALSEAGMSTQSYYSVSEILDVQKSLQKRLPGENDWREYWLEDLYMVKPQYDSNYYVCYAQKQNRETYYYDVDGNVHCVLDSSGKEKDGWRTDYRKTLEKALEQAGIWTKTKYSEYEIRDLQSDFQPTFDGGNQKDYAIGELYVVETAKENGYQYVCYSRVTENTYIGVVDGRVHYDTDKGWGNYSKQERFSNVILELGLGWKSYYTVKEISDIQTKINTTDNVLIHDLYHSNISLKSVYYFGGDFYVKSEGQLVRVYDQKIFDYEVEQNYLSEPSIKNGVVQFPGVMNDYRAETWRFSAAERRTGEVTFARLKEIQK